MLKIAKLEISNLGILDDVSLDLPATGLIAVSGKNGSGKSTLLYALRYLWAGVKKGEAEELIKNGAKKAEISVRIYEYPDGDLVMVTPEATCQGILKYIISRNITADGASAIVVTTPDGAKFPSPKSLADGFRQDLGLDPHEFARGNDKDQYDLCLKIAKFDYSRADMIKKLQIADPLASQAQELFAEDEIKVINPLEDINQLRQAIYDERRKIGVERDYIQSQIITTLIPPEYDSTQEIDTLALISEEFSLRQKQEQQNFIHIELERKTSAINMLQSTCINIEANIRKIDKEILKLIVEKTGCEVTINNLKKDMEEMQSKEISLQKAISDFPDMAVKSAQIAEQMKKADEVNSWVTRRKNKTRLEDELLLKKGSYNLKTDIIKNIDDYKANILNTAKFPLPGLSVDDTTNRVIYNGIPIKRLGECEQTIVGCAIAASLRPQLRTIVCPHDILVDNDSRQKWQDWCNENNYQVLYCDILKDSDEIAVYIDVKDGSASIKKGGGMKNRNQNN